MSALAALHAWRALDIRRTLGVRRAAGFLRNRGVCIEDALFILVGRRAR